jgi:hypothetical protein
MLKIDVPLSEKFDDDTETFVVTDSFTLELEHSLATLSKWEQSFEKPFLGDGEKTREETLAYIEMMILNPEVPPEVWSKVSAENFDQINEYIHAKMTATWFREERQTPSRETITAEIIYHWMINYNIWLDAEHWHLNKLLTLIRVCNEKSKPPKKRNAAEMIAERQRINAERLAKGNTSG